MINHLVYPKIITYIKIWLLYQVYSIHVYALLQNIADGNISLRE